MGQAAVPDFHAGWNASFMRVHWDVILGVRVHKVLQGAVSIARVQSVQHSVPAIGSDERMNYFGTSKLLCGKIRSCR